MGSSELTHDSFSIFPSVDVGLGALPSPRVSGDDGEHDLGQRGVRRWRRL